MAQRTVMQSTNFEYLRPHQPELADLGGFAEQYAYADPSSSLIKLRMVGELVVSTLFSKMGFSRIPQMNFLEMLQADELRAFLPKVLQDKLHFLRREGNSAAHGRMSGQPTALAAIQEAYDISKWVFLTLYGGKL